MIRFSALNAKHQPLESAPVGSERYILIGTVVTMDGNRQVHQNGAVGIDGAIIAFVAATADQIPDAWASWPVVETHGTIFPGLIDLHNHLSYNMLPFWQVDRRYDIRDQWQHQQPEYTQNVSRPFNVLAKHPDKDYARAIARFAECRSLFGGVTSGQGVSASLSQDAKVGYQGLVRNVEFPPDADWPAAFGQTPDLSRDDVATKLVPALEKDAAYIYHLSEGTNASARQHFLDLQLPDGNWAINHHLVCTHCVALKTEDFDRLAHSGGMIWSPTSNLLLYGETAKVNDAIARGVRISLGVDWAPSGCKNMLDELKVARAVSTYNGWELSAADLVAMATANPATMLGWQQHVGTIEQGKRADLLVIEGIHADPYSALIQARETDIRAILIDGVVRLAKAEPWTIAHPDSTEAYIVGGIPYHLDVPAPSGIWQRMTLATAVAKLSYGLEHLREVEAAASTQHMLWHEAGISPDKDWWIEGDMMPETPFEVFIMAPPAEIPHIPLRLAPLTRVDDPDFTRRFKANPNLPEYLRTVLD